MVSSRRVKLQPNIINCIDCRMTFRAENLTPYTIAVREWYCPACGSTNVEIKTNSALDRWYAMAESFGLPSTEKSVSLIKSLYDVWDTHEHSLFKDFVVEVLAESNLL